MTTEDFPKLFQFLGAYFHEDWMCEFDLADDVIRAFLADSEDCVVEGVIKEINALLVMNVTENKIRDFLLKEIGCCYCYWHDWQDGNTWLKHIFVVIRKAPYSNI
ncbi:MULTISPECIES: contact-dependent growth inhibition system immunity protein [unclassified Pseudomonas]|uniref:contact-dependent growth inhibition system immunity protein n=1 Tax=unclassified Pseudomonas TaxID=196821 RepID=UPI002892FDB9|nr:MULTISPECIES: contact-dependent growth inhibition system immunity protein [unclassified Pseudomonas]